MLVSSKILDACSNMQILNIVVHMESISRLADFCLRCGCTHTHIRCALTYLHAFADN